MRGSWILQFFLMITTTSKSMDPELAKKLFHEGATLFIIDVPQGTEFGIDYNSWTVGPNFKGVKMIPPGFHFVFYRYRYTVPYR